MDMPLFNGNPGYNMDGDDDGVQRVGDGDPSMETNQDHEMPSSPGGDAFHTEVGFFFLYLKLI